MNSRDPKALAMLVAQYDERFNELRPRNVMETLTNEELSAKIKEALETGKPVAG